MCHRKRIDVGAGVGQDEILASGLAHDPGIAGVSVRFRATDLHRLWNTAVEPVK